MNTRVVKTCLFIFVSMMLMTGTPAAGEETRTVDHSLSGNTYVNRTYNCTLSMPATGNWSMTLKNEKGDVLEFANGKLYDANGTLSVNKYPVITFEAMKVGVLKTYKTDALLNTIDIGGKKAILVERTVVVQNQKVATRTYFIVKDSVQKKDGQGLTEGVVYVLVFGYLAQGDQDKAFVKQLEDIAQSFAYLDERPMKTSSTIIKDK